MISLCARINRINYKPQNSVLHGTFFAVLGYGLFSVHDSLVKLLADYSVFQIIFFAALFSNLPFSIYKAIDPKPSKLKPNNIKLVFFRSILIVTSLCLVFLAFSKLPLVQVYVLLFITPVIVSILAIFFLGETISYFRWSAIALAMVGVILVLRPSPDSFHWAQLAGLGAAMCGAGASIISRMVGNTESASTLIIYPLITNLIITGSMLIFVYIPMPLKDLTLMFLIGVLAMTGQVCIINAFRRASAALVSSIQYSQLIWAIMIGTVFYNDIIDKYTLIGAGIIILSGLLIVWRETVNSKNQPNLRIRNYRNVVAPRVASYEFDEASDKVK